MDVKHYFYYTDEISWYLVLLPDLRSDKLITILNQATSDRLVKLEIRQKDGDIPAVLPSLLFLRSITFRKG